MSNVVTFDPTLFKARYPLFCNVDGQRLGFYFDEAAMILSNAPDSLVCDLTERRMLLWLLVAHIALLNGAVTTDGQPAPVGAVVSATEGTVSVSFNYNAAPGTQAWFQQTQFGLLYWQSTARYRTMRYIAQPTGWNRNVPYPGR